MNPCIEQGVSTDVHQLFLYSGDRSQFRSCQFCCAINQSPFSALSTCDKCSHFS
ncbi:hypothetical protein DPMN_148355 [Dreissena polymorpha]|uniref:Uncharacterized protein n=1 Tax=Dreissena polymorpha TaxID=45954 RepID=A0A9D4FDX0_DREPO|nr:hypothetical protein DPMN_148355 [Dreissena polymorpha]